MEWVVTGLWLTACVGWYYIGRMRGRTQGRREVLAEIHAVHMHEHERLAADSPWLDEDWGDAGPPFPSDWREPPPGEHPG